MAVLQAYSGLATRELQNVVERPSSLPTGARSRLKICRATCGTMPAPRFES
jgi:hypothetical protein